EAGGERFGRAHLPLLGGVAHRQRRLLAREALAVGEIDKTLEIDFADIDLVREPDKIAELIDGLLEPGQPQRHAWPLDLQFALQRAEGADVADDAGEHVPPAHLEKRARLGGVERYAQLIEAAR